MAQLGSIKDIYSEDTIAAQNKLNEIESSKPGPYSSQYQGTLDSLLDQIVNRKDFSYDFNADPLYQQYKDQYTQLGNQAMMNTAANAATLTGGYGNSYATTAASQANQQYLSQLNNVIPELYSLAMSKYQLDGDTLNNKYATVGDAEDRNYGHYRDTVTDWQSDRSYYYNKYSGSVSNDQYVSNYNQSDNQYSQNMAYNQSRDEVSDSQWQQQFESQNSQWQQEFDYQKQQDALNYALSLARANSSSRTSSDNDDEEETSNVPTTNSLLVPRGEEAVISGNPLTVATSTAKNLANTKSITEAQQYLVDQVNSGNITEVQAKAIAMQLQ